MKKILTISFALLLLSTANVAIKSESASAADLSKFRAGNLIDDSVFQNTNTMSVSSVQQFLNAKNSVCLRSYQTPSINGNNTYGGNVSAAQAIVQAANLWNINPQVLLVTMQKENSLITRTNCPDYVYKSSLGVGCPDTAPCDTQYFGLSRQLYQGARWLRNYFDRTPGWYTLTPGVNYIRYNPEAGCGGTNINIVNRATAALYTFTPYQPNAAALAAGTGLGDGCSAHGNRNFWIYFNDWFGSTYAGDAVYAVADNGDPRQWIIHNGVRYHVPSVEVINAWKLGQNQPLVQLSSNYLGSFSDGPNITTSIRDNVNGWEYLVDNGTKYHYLTGAQETAWRADPRQSYPRELINTYLQDGGDLGYAVKFKGESAIYMVDDGQLRQYSSIQLLRAIESIGSVEIASSLKGKFTVGQPLNTNKFTSNNTDYFVDAARKMKLDGAYSQLYPGQAQSVSANTIDRLSSIKPTYFVKAKSSDAIYLVDSGQKRHVTSIELLQAYAKNRDIPSDIMTTLTDDTVQSFLPTGSALTSMYATSGGKKYIIDGRAVYVNNSLQSAYIGTNDTSNVISPSLVSEIGEVAANRFATDSSGKYYYIDGSEKRWIKNLETYISLADSDRLLTKLSEVPFSSIKNGTDIETPFIKDSDNLVWYISGNNKYSLNAKHVSDWNISKTSTINAVTLTSFNSLGEVSNNLTINDEPYFVTNGRMYKDTKNYISIWTDDQNKTLPNSVVGFLSLNGSLTRFARSTDSRDTRIFAKDKDKLIHMSTIPSLQNFAGSDSLETIPLSPMDIQSSTIVGSSLVSVQLGDTSLRLIVGGKLHSYSTSDVGLRWKTADTVTISSQLATILGNGSLQIKDVVLKASGKDEIYSIEGGTKRWIYYTPYINRYIHLPVSTMNNTFVQAYPSGSAVIN